MRRALDLFTVSTMDAVKSGVTEAVVSFDRSQVDEITEAEDGQTSASGNPFPRRPFIGQSLSHGRHARPR